jgi:hypothetical protein
MSETKVETKNSSAYRVDFALMGADDEQLAPLSAAGATLEEAIWCYSIAVAPHLEQDRVVQVIRVGRFCKPCGVYHDVGQQMEAVCSAVERVADIGRLDFTAAIPPERLEAFRKRWAEVVAEFGGRTPKAPVAGAN